MSISQIIFSFGPVIVVAFTVGILTVDAAIDFDPCSALNPLDHVTIDVANVGRLRAWLAGAIIQGFEAGCQLRTVTRTLTDPIAHDQLAAFGIPPARAL